MSDDDRSRRRKLNPPLVILIILGLAFVGLLLRGNEASRVTSGSDAIAELQVEYAADAGADEMEQSGPVTADRIDRTLLPQERENWRSDPSSRGWNEADRQFFEEHGVSESEARAMETIMRENGVE